MEKISFFSDPDVPSYLPAGATYALNIPQAFRVIVDYGLGEWSLYVDGQLAVTQLFFSSGAVLENLDLRIGTIGRIPAAREAFLVDNIRISKPGLDTDGDGVLDDVERLPG